ncbi:AAA family ATPase [Thermaurantimonas aggregans]|nr:AAA family ATPase [Thermaurantimonas aggregans]
MHIEPKRVVITGGPGSGKTTILNQLRKRGFPVFEEISREIIRQSLQSGSDILPWDNLMDFSREVFFRRAKQYHAANDGLSFYDRSVIDTLAYLPLDNLTPDEEMTSWALHHKYFPSVFIAPPWREIYNRDPERREDWTTAVRIHDFLTETYTKFGYTLISIPFYTPEKRAEFILRKIEELEQFGYR